MAPTIAFVTKKRDRSLFLLTHLIIKVNLYTIQSIYVYNWDYETHTQKKKTKSFAIVPKQRKIETAAKEGGNIRILENSSMLCISLFHISRPLVPDTVFTRCNHAFTYPRSSNKISGRRRDGLTEKRVHPRRRRRRGSGGILDERRRPLAFPLLGQCPRASRVVSSTTTRSVCAPLLAEFLERATPTTRHVLTDEIRKKARIGGGVCVFPPRPTHDVHEEGPHNACAGNLRDRLPCHYCSTELWWWLWWW